MTVFRNGKVEDAAEMADIFNFYVRTSPVIFSDTVLSADDMRTKIKRLGIGDRFPFIIAEDNSKMLGYAYTHLWQSDPVYDHTWELTMYLSHDATGKGLGSMMLPRLVAECQELGAHALIACITEGNAPSERMVTKAGFTLAGVCREVGYKFGKYYSDAIYQLLLR